MTIIILLIGQLTLADRLYQAGYYKEAELEYQRVLFFTSSIEEKKTALKRLVFCYFYNGKNDRAISTLKELIITDTLNRFHYTVALVKIYIRSQYYSLARLEIKGLLSQAPNESLRSQAQRLSGINNVLRDDYIHARADFVAVGDSVMVNKVDQYFRRPQKSRFKAQILSSLFPGLGDFYAGNYRLGIIDFSLNFGSGFLLYNAIKKRKMFDAALVFSFLTVRFYNGARNNAASSTRAFNERKKFEYLRDLEIIFSKDLALE